MSNMVTHRQLTEEQKDRCKKCPFCGESDLVGEYGLEHRWCIHCEVCKTQGPKNITLADAIKLWNKREE